MTTISRPETTAPVHAPQRSRWLAWLSVVLLVVGLGAGFFIGRATKADTPPDLASTSAVNLMNDFAAAVNAGHAEEIAQFFTADAVSVGPGDSSGTPLPIVGAQRIGESLASLRETLGLRITNPGTAVQRGSWVSQPVDVLDSKGVLVVRVIDNKIAYQLVMWEP